ncbi:MAG: Ig-like domain-containing protein, partial [Planctomycetota bacterium]
MKRFFSILTATIILGSYFVNKAIAQDTFGLNSLLNGGGDNALILGSRPIEETVARIINVVLGFLGVIAVLLILYAGFIWMTSQGNSEKIQRAKLILISAVIGLLIVLSAYTLARFIISRLGEATNANNITANNNNGTVPTGCTEPLNGEIKFCRVSPLIGPATTRVSITGWYFNAYNGNISKINFVQGANRTEAEITTCGGGPVNWTEGNPQNYYNVTISVPDVPMGLYDIEIVTDGNGSATYLNSQFEVTNTVPGPGIDCLVPSQGAIGTFVEIHGVRFGANNPPPAGDIIFMNSEAGFSIIDPNVPDPEFVSWADDKIEINIKDDAVSSDLRVKVGGLDSNPKYFQVICNNNAECPASNCCFQGFCREASYCAVSDPGAPYITNLSPDNGAVGNLITIYGSKFGVNPGFVRFTDNANQPINGLAPNHTNVQCNTAYWFDNHIIIQVPLGAVDGTLDLVTSDGKQSNTVFFDQNDVVRPGLCYADPSSGAFERQIDLYGNNFTATDEVLFGGILGYNSAITPDSNPADGISDDSAVSDVPNLQAGEVGIQIRTDPGETSNQLPFLVLDSSGGNPVITGISYPDNDTAAPLGQYITVLGANLGNIQGDLFFDYQGLNEETGDFSFPAQCRDSFWRNDRVVVKVPAGLATAANGDYILKIIRNDGAESNEFEFFVLDKTLQIKPGICKLAPDNGPAGTQLVRVYGDNFGTTDNSVIFYEEESTNNFAFWENQEIRDVTVPVNARTGPVVVEHANSARSNELMFNVGTCPDNDDQYCQNLGLGQFCCSDPNGNHCDNSCGFTLNQCIYPWTITTEAKPFELLYNFCGDANFSRQTPSPWVHGMADAAGTAQDSTTAYVDSNLWINFTRNVDDSTLIDPNNFIVWECPSGQGPNLTCDASVYPGANQISGQFSIIDHNSEHEGIMFVPDSDLQPDRWYSVELGQSGLGFKAAVGGDIWPNGPAPLWTFKTRAAANACVPAIVNISPDQPQANVYVGQIRNFSALSADIHCNPCGGDYNWSWTIASDPTPTQIHINTPAIDTLANNRTPMGTTNFTGLEATENLNPNYVEIQVQMPDFIDPNTGNPITDIAWSTVQAPVLEVVDYQPNCSDSCANAVVQITFNTDVADNANNRNVANYFVEDTANPGNNITTAVLGVPSNTITLNNSGLTAGATYRVTVNRSITNTDGYQLNDGNSDFSWTFKVGNGGNCAFDSIRVTPVDYISNHPSQTIGYTA